MIYLIAGRPRSGKTFESVKYHIIPALKKGRKVITNVPINVDHCCNMLGEHVRELIQVVDFKFNNFEGKSTEFYFSRPEHYQDEWRNESGQGPLYVVDECHFPLPKGKTTHDLKNFYTMHGHYGIDILLMSQQPRQIDADVLGLVEIVYRTIKRTALGSDKTYTKKVQDGWRGEVVNTEGRSYDKAIFPYYKSHTQSSKDVLEAQAADIKPIWAHWSFKGAALMFVLFIVMIMSFDVNVLATPQVKSQEVQAEPMPQRSPQPRLETPQPQFSNEQSKPEPVPPPPAKEEKKPPSHPYHRIRFHIVGTSEYGPFERPTHTINFSASRNGQHLFALSSKDLYLAGYDVQYLNPCLVQISFGEFEDYIICDSPTVSPSIGGADLASH